MQNKRDLEKAKEENLPKHLLDRLLLNESRIISMCEDIINITKLKDPLGIILDTKTALTALKSQR